MCVHAEELSSAIPDECCIVARVWQSCVNPSECLLYMQCMTKGVVKDEKDRNMCRYSYSGKDWSRVDQNIVLLDANISRWELGCDRGDINCPPSSGSDR